MKECNSHLDACWWLGTARAHRRFCRLCPHEKGLHGIVGLLGLVVGLGAVGGRNGTAGHPLIPPALLQCSAVHARRRFVIFAQLPSPDTT